MTVEAKMVPCENMLMCVSKNEPFWQKILKTLNVHLNFSTAHVEEAQT